MNCENSATWSQRGQSSTDAGDEFFDASVVDERDFFVGSQFVGLFEIEKPEVDFFVRFIVEDLFPVL